jgi:two-component system, response regulator PdtaR
MLFSKRERRIRRILIAEDEPLVAFDSEHMLGEDGYEVVATVDNVADAERVIAEEPLDLILADIALTGDRSGVDLARIAAAKGVPVLFVTGNCPEEARGLSVGCLAKPYTEKTLKSALEVLDRALQGLKVKKLPAGLSLYAV